MVIIFFAIIGLVLGTIKTKADYIEAFRVALAELIIEGVILVPCIIALTNHESLKTETR